MKLISWNIDSLNAALTGSSKRAYLSRKVLKTIIEYDPEIFAIQETKLSPTGPTKKHLQILKNLFPDYKVTWRSSKPPARKSYGGTMFLYKNILKPRIFYPKINAPAILDKEGRILTLELTTYFITQVYTPNADNSFKRLHNRQTWDLKYLRYLSSLDSKKPVISSGDFAVAHRKIDLAYQKPKYPFNEFIKKERNDFTQLLKSGFCDTFRFIHGDIKGAYSWWDQRIKTSKANNFGSRPDYYLVSDRIKNKIANSKIIDSGPRADHAPIYLEINI